MSQTERRSGKERRIMPPAPVSCSVPCKAIDDKITRIENCVKEKTPQRLFYWVIGGICTFVVFIIGGAQWTIVDKMSRVDTNLQVMAVTVLATAKVLDKHLDHVEDKEILFETRIKELEKEVYRMLKEDVEQNN